MTSVIDLNPRSLETVQCILADHVPGCEVRAYGSRARWEAKDYSDLDLAVVGDGPLDYGVLGDLKEAFEESDLPIRVDVVDWYTINDAFRERIEADCVVLKRASSTICRSISHLGYTLVPTGWETRLIGEFASLTYGRGLPKVKRVDDGEVRVYGSSGVVGFHNEALTRGPTVVVGRKGTVGSVHYSPDPCWPIDTTFYIEGEDPTIQRYIYYALRFANLSSLNSDSAVPGLNRNQAHGQSLLIPPIQEQRRISAVLGALDDKIELNRRMSETLDEMGRALFKSWFVDFDPVHAKAEGRPTGLPPEIDSLFPNTFQPSELGPIPTGWHVRALCEVIDVNPRRSIRQGDVATHVEMASMPTAGPQVAELGSRPFASGSRFALGDTLLARISPSLENGKTALVDFLNDGEIGWGSTELIVLRPKALWPPEIAYLLARESTFRKHAIINRTGTSGRQRVPAEAISTYRLAVPPSDVAVACGSVAQSWFRDITRLGRQSRTLAALRDTLLPKLLAGEVRVSPEGSAVLPNRYPPPAE